MSDGSSVISNALANLGDGKNVQVEKVLKLNKTEVMDLILEEVIDTLRVEAETAQAAADAANEAFHKDLEAYVLEQTGFTELHKSRYDDHTVSLSHCYDENDKRNRLLNFTVDKLTAPSGLKLVDRNVDLRIMAPEWAYDREAEVARLMNEARELRERRCEVSSSKVKFKSAVLRSLLNEHEEGQALLAKVKDVAKKLAG